VSSLLKQLFGDSNAPKTPAPKEHEEVRPFIPAKLPPRREETSTPKTPADLYVALRSQALSFQRSVINLPTPSDDSPVWAILMETGYPNGVGTLLSVADGTASLYFSRGGGIFGGQLNDAIRLASLAFISLSGKCCEHLTLTNSFPLPELGQTVFYFRTDAGVLTCKCLEMDLSKGQHVLSPLFHQGHAVITQMRLLSEGNKLTPIQKKS
jgi:hypothetical protein